ncbi:hypothetical protein KKE03_01085 [Patescibacteria group bacterium]|nr:hypothetical protein [Patescibacteria group bacterium]
MPISVTGKNYALISTCDLTSSQGAWSGVDTPDTVDKKQGDASLCGTLKAAGNNITTFIPTGSPTTKLNLSNKHVRFWLLITSGGLVNTYALGGIQFWATNGTQTGYWYVGGRDTYPGGWYNFVVDMSKPVDNGTKPSDMTQITQIGTCHNLTAAGKNVDNIWIDHFSVCDGLVVSGDIDTGVMTCGANSAGTYTRSAGSFLTDGFRVGMDFTASGYANSGNNGNKTISTVTATVITVTDATGMVTETGDADERIRGYVGLQEVFAVTDVPSTAHSTGILTRKAGVYCLVGSLEVGLATSLTRFQVKSQAVVFENRPNKDGTLNHINSSLMKILVTDSGDTNYTTEFILGAKSGTQGISGCTVRSQSVTQLSKFSVDASGANVDNFKLYGTSFLGATTISLPANAATAEVLNCNFEACGQVAADTCVVKYCNFISADSAVDAAVLINDDPHYVTDSNFISCPKGIELDTVGDAEYSFTNLLFSGNTYDVNNTSGSSLTVMKAGTSNPTTYTGSTVTFAGSASLVIDIVDADGDAITENCEVTIVRNSDTTILFEEDNIVDGSTTYDYTTGGGTVTYINIHNVTGYQSKTMNNYTLPSTGTTTLTVQLDNDPYYANP